MPPALVSVQVRVPPEMRDRWAAKAAGLGVTLPEFVRSCVEQTLAGPVPAPRGSTTGGTGHVTVECRWQQRHKKGVRCGYCHQTP
jgi:hypothetical protein